jgi:molybdopterin-synthase adenylyltransferase
MRWGQGVSGEGPLILHARQVAIIQTEAGALVKRGSTEIAIRGERAAEISHIIFTGASGAGASLEELEASFAYEERTAVRSLIAELTARDMLYSSSGHATEYDEDETAADLFYWHFGLDEATARTRLAAKSFAIVGVNSLGDHIANGLRSAGACNIVVVDDPILRNVRMFDETGALVKGAWSETNPTPEPIEDWRRHQSIRCDCLIAASDFGGRALLGRWNEHALKQGIHFLPVTLHNTLGHVGPFVIKDETACLECLRIRLDANSRDTSNQRYFERAASNIQRVTGFHPLIADVVAKVAVFEIMRFYTGLPGWKIGMLTEINLLGTSIVSRRVLRVPRCPACSPLERQSTTATFKNPLYLPD